MARYGTGGMTARLEVLAGKNELRLTVLKARKERQISRTRFVTCSVCLDRGYSDRDQHDICDKCLISIWGAENVINGEYRAGKKDGLCAVCCTTAPHWLPYPQLATSGNDVPEDAVFARPDHRGKPERSDRTLQILYVEIMEAFAEALPCDPKSRAEAEPLISGGQGNGYGADANSVYARLPSKALKPLRDLWHLFRWHSQAAYNHGFDAGRDLLSQMNLGQLTAESFMIEIEEQTKRQQERLQRMAEGKSYGTR
jgi:hypothetical protein